MKMELVFVGKTTQDWIRMGTEDYLSRLQHYIPCTVRLVQPAGTVSPEKAKEREGAAILQKIEPRDFVVLLDEKGREFSSVELADWIAKKASEATGRIVFVTGGAYGVSQDVFSRANLLLAASRFTFTHQMIRVILAEQLYRAMTIIRNESYHHI